MNVRGEGTIFYIPGVLKKLLVKWILLKLIILIFGSAYRFTKVGMILHHFLNFDSIMKVAEF